MWIMLPALIFIIAVGVIGAALLFLKKQLKKAGAFIRRMCSKIPIFRRKKD